MPWITLKDIARIYVHAVNSQLDGVFNASSANISNEKLTKAVAPYLKKPLSLPNVPGVVLKTVLGEMSSLVLEGVRIDNSKILDTGVEFQLKTLHDALE